MSDDLEEFEDAIDCERLCEATAGVSTFKRPAPPEAVLRETCNQPLDSYRNRISTSCSTSPMSFGQPLEGSLAASRRDRLTALRRRMREEFGARDLGLSHGMTSDYDTLSVASEATSLHSWHRRVLASSHTMVVHPSDSMSTRAGPSNSIPPSNSLSQVYSQPEPIMESDPLTVSLSHPSVAPASAPSSSLMSPTGPPPSHPPPPLPSRELTRQTSSDLRSPPPLPPRNPSLRLPDPVSTDLIVRLNVPETESPPNAQGPSIEAAQQQQAQQQQQQSHVQRGSSTSNDSLLMPSGETVNGSGRRRGHTKTNSLDRGLTLAKSLKAGPFPPPSNKSNSLTRQELDDDGEECARNTAAEGVILQITTKIIGDQPVRSRDGDLEPIASESSSISSPSSEMSRKMKELKSTKAKALQEQSVDEAVENTENTEKEASVDVAERIQNGGGDETNTADGGSLEISLSSSIDPITRDVERRMSMKRDCPLSSETMSDEVRLERFPCSRSSFDHAKTWARSYGSYATGLFRGAFQRMKSAAHGGASVKVDDTSDSEGEQSESGLQSTGHNGSIVRPRKGKKGPFDFEQLRVVQELNNEHTGAVWCVRFSVCGRLMATAGQDNIIRVWAARSHLKYFIQMRERYQQKTSDACGSPNEAFQSAIHDMESFRPPSSIGSNTQSEITGEEEDSTNLFSAKPFVVFKGHTADILDLSWSKNYFILSSGMDRTVKLWHLSRGECLCCFQHVDFVTSVAFLPKDDRYFLSGSLDGKLRMWHIPDKKVAVWNEVPVKFITAITFVKNGKFAVVGTYNGRCFFYSTDQLKYHTVVDVRSSRGKNARGHKVTGLAVHGDKLLVTSNDSRIRMYDVRDKALTCKFRGAQNEHSQIRAAFSPDGRHIVCGSEDKFIYLWRTSDLPSTLSVRKDRNAMWERVRAHSAPVSVAVFAPKPQVFLSMMAKQDEENRDSNSFPGTCPHIITGHVIVSADLQGSIKIMVNRPKLNKTGQSPSAAQD
uniref:WD repeat-containing protein 44 n=2 Tax=Trichostrongylidae TaxID=6315 RepID=A0A7I4Z138_HAECO